MANVLLTAALKALTALVLADKQVIQDNIGLRDPTKGEPWTPYTPVVVGSSGGAATATGRYKVIGKTLAFQVEITVTANGNINSISLPAGAVSAATFQTVGGRERNTTGKTWSGNVAPGATTFYVADYANSVGIVAGYSIDISGVIEIV